MSGFSIERVYPHPRERVWRAITEPELLARWLMPNDFAPVVGHEFTFRTEPGPGFDGIVRCRVLAVEPPHSVSFTWTGGPIDTVVTITLFEHPDGTRLSMLQTGFRGLKAWLVSRMLKIGSRQIYGERLPRVLDELAGRGAAGERSPEACMTRGQGLLAKTLSLLQRRSR